MNNSSLKILIADDDEDDALLLAEALLDHLPSCQCIHATNGLDALNYIKANVNPDIVFLDLNMPCKNGLECLTEIRKEPRLSNLPIIVYSSSTNMVDIHRSYIHKADLYMVKPFNTEHLKNALQSILNMKWREDNSNQKFYFINNRFVPFTAHSV